MEASLVTSTVKLSPKTQLYYEYAKGKGHWGRIEDFINEAAETSFKQKGATIKGYAVLRLAFLTHRAMLAAYSPT